MLLLERLDRGVLLDVRRAPRPCRLDEVDDLAREVAETPGYPVRVEELKSSTRPQPLHTFMAPRKSVSRLPIEVKICCCRAMDEPMPWAEAAGTCGAGVTQK